MKIWANCARPKIHCKFCIFLFGRAATRFLQIAVRRSVLTRIAKLLRNSFLRNSMFDAHGSFSDVSSNIKVNGNLRRSIIDVGNGQQFAALLFQCDGVFWLRSERGNNGDRIPLVSFSWSFLYYYCSSRQVSECLCYLSYIHVVLEDVGDGFHTNNELVRGCQKNLIRTD